MITPEKFHAIFPSCKNPSGWVAAMSDMFPVYGMKTKERQAMFIAQCGHESGGWSRFEENLRYTAPRLVQIFKKYFPTLEAAKHYEGKPQMIASKVYGNRMGNGPEASGDGWKFRGRGPIQLTGKNNYTAFSTDTTGSLQYVDNPDLVAKDVGVCLKSALWYWQVNNLNEPSDARDVKTVTKRINGGFIGLEERAALFSKVLQSI